MMVFVASTPMSATKSCSSTSSSSSSSISLPPIKILTIPSARFLRVLVNPSFMRLKKPPFADASASSALVSATTTGLTTVCSFVSTIGTLTTGKLGNVTSSSPISASIKNLFCSLDCCCMPNP